MADLANSFYEWNVSRSQDLASILRHSRRLDNTLQNIQKKSGWIKPA